MTRGQFPGSPSVSSSVPSRPPRRVRPARAIAGLLALIALAGAPAAALAEGSARPVSPAQQGLRPLAEVPAWTSPPVDARALREDAARGGKTGTPLRIGFRMAADLSPATAGAWEDLDNGDRIWRLRVRTAGALWVVLGFDQFRLEPGATLFVYDPALQAPRSYTAADVRDHGELWTPPIEGDELVVELLWPAELAGVEPRLHLGAVSHGFLPFGTIGRAKAGTDGIGDSGSCNIDVACPLGVNWQDEKRGAVILLSGGEGFCSGSLINTTANDCRPYVLTAAHCGAGTSTVFGFNFERSACNSGDPPPPSTYTVSGATVLANYSSSDFTLLQMNSSPPEEFDVYYNGWNRGTTPPNESIVIHHPRGDVKKIAYDDDPATDGSNWGPNHWRIGEYEQGTTEPGSSGSPLFDQNHHIIGQLHGGTASCTSITYDEYGKLDASWIGGGTSASRLSDWLDPNVTGQLTMDGVAGSVCAFNPTGSISLDSATYACTDAMLITLRDDNLRGYETQAVTVTSGTETAPETVVLTALEPGSGFFTGTFPVAPGAPVNGDGHLSVSPGDVVTVLYIDEDDGNGGVNVPVTTTALIDCAGPVISGVASQNVTGNSAQVVWTTDELATASVTYDTVVPPAAGSAGSAVVTVSHLVPLTGLQPCTTYYYSVTSTDPAGNPTTDTNGGAYYSFRTGSNTNPTYPYTGAPVPIPDNDPAGASAVINVPYFDYVTKVVVTVNLTHSYDGDIALTLTAPDGRTVPLATRRGGSGDNYVATVFDDDAATAISAGSPPFTGSFRPESPLAALNGIPSYGDWTLKVVDSAGGDSGTITGWSLQLLFPPAPCGAQVSLDADAYSCSGTATITVRDTNVAGPELTVQAASATDAAGETVTLARLAAPQDTWFRGTVALTAAPASAGDGLVSVVHADTLTVTYLDADDGQGNFDVPVTDTAAADCAAPVISNVFASDVTGNGAVIQWTTDDLATSVVRYGLAIPPDLTTSAGALVGGHAVALTGLTACATYYYAVESVDAYGNLTVDTNGGAYYLFTTLQNTNAVYTSTDTPLAIPDNDATGATSTINVPDLDRIVDLDVVVNVTHSYDGDISLSLVAPDGTTIALSTRRGSSGDNYTGTVFDDAAATAIANGSAPFSGSYRPENPLAAVNGQVAAGAWKLKVVDSASSDSGTIQDWSLRFTYEPRACGPSAVYQSFSVAADACAAGGPGDGNGIVDRGEEVTLPVVVRNNGSVDLTGISATLTTAPPDVYVTRPSAAYPDLPVNQTAPSLAPHFAFIAGQGVPCGGEIAFVLTVHTAQGSFSSPFTVQVGALAYSTTTYPSTDVPKPIPDNDPAGASSTIAVTDGNPVQAIKVKVNVTHTYDGDLTLSLIGPNGVSVALSNRRGSSGDNFVDTVFDDGAATPIASGTAPFTGAFKPETPLGALAGIPANGTWTLKAVDSAGSDSGTITGWSLELTTGSGYACNDCASAPPTSEPVQQAWIGKTAQQWEPIAGATSYRLYRGAAADLPALLTAANDSCLRLETTEPYTGPVLLESPPAGGLYWYLVRAANAGGEGPAGNATDGPRLQSSTGACP